VNNKIRKIDEKLAKLVRQFVEDWQDDLESGKAISPPDAVDALVAFVRQGKALLQQRDGEQEAWSRAQDSLTAMLRGKSLKDRQP